MTKRAVACLSERGFNRSTLSDLFLDIVVLPQRLKIAGNSKRNLLAQVINPGRGGIVARDLQSPRDS